MTEITTKGGALHSLYAYPQPAGLCALREYLLVERNADGLGEPLKDVPEGRLLFLRFLKECDFTVDSMTFDITMLDAVGSEMGQITVTLRDSDIPQAETGHVFTPDVGIPVAGGCMDIRIRMREVTSGDYVYRAEGMTVTVDYLPPEPWRYDPRAGAAEGLTETHSLRVRSKRSGKVRHLWPVALLTALLMVYFIARPFWDLLLERLLESI